MIVGRSFVISVIAIKYRQLFRYERSWIQVYPVPLDEIVDFEHSPDNWVEHQRYIIVSLIHLASLSVYMHFLSTGREFRVRMSDSCTSFSFFFSLSYKQLLFSNISKQRLLYITLNIYLFYLHNSK